MAGSLFAVLNAEGVITRTTLGPLDTPLGMLGPMLAAIATRLLFKESFKGSINWKRPWHSYAVAFFFPTVLGLIAILINHLSGLAHFTLAGDSPLGLISQLILIGFTASITAVGEEYGWRGYLLPKLRPLGAARASMLSGLVWGAWHLPLVLTGLIYPGQPATLAVPVFLCSVLLISFLMTWVYKATSGSVLAAALVHGSLNMLSELTSQRHMPVGNPMFTAPFGITTAVVVFVGVMVLWSRQKIKETQQSPRN